MISGHIFNQILIDQIPNIIRRVVRLYSQLSIIYIKSGINMNFIFIWRWDTRASSRFLFVIPFLRETLELSNFIF